MSPALRRGRAAVCGRSSGAGSRACPSTRGAAAPARGLPPRSARRPSPPRSPATAPGVRAHSRATAAAAAAPPPAMPRAGAARARPPAPGTAPETPPCTAASTGATAARPAPAGSPAARTTRGSARRTASPARGARTRGRRGTAPEEHPAVQADQGQPLGVGSGPPERFERRRPFPEVRDHRPSPLVTMRSPWTNEMTIPIGLRTTSSAGISGRNEKRIETDQDSRATSSAPRIRTQSNG